MADPTASDLLLSDEAFAERFLSFTGKSVLAAAAKIDRVTWTDFWSGIRTNIETSTSLNPQDGDSNELKGLKKKLKDKAFQIFLKFQGDASDIRDKSIGDSEVIKQSRVYTSQLESIVENIRSNETVRIAQTLMGPENLDPIDIRISEVHTISRLGTIRSDTDAAIKLPKSITQITMDLVFAGPAQINHVFRPLLANLLASPITTVESPMLTAALINHYSTPEIEEQIRRRAVGQSTLTADFEKFTEQAAASFENLRDIIENNDLVIEYYRQLALSKEEKAGDVARAETEPQAQTLPNIGVSIPVAFQDIVISSDPATPNTLHVRISFLRYNSKAFGSFGLEYRDSNGNRTSDIMNCKPLADYAEWAFLQQGAGRGTYLEEYKAHTFGNTPDFRCTWFDIVKPDMERTLDTEEFVVESVQIAFGMKIVPLPVIGAKYPAIHVLGRGNAQARIVLQTPSIDAMRQVMVMKDHMDAISRNVSGMFRDESITVENSVLNLVGTKKFLIQAAEVTPLEGTSDAYNIELTMVQAEYNYRAQESLILEDQSIPREAFDDLWDLLWNYYQEFRQYADEKIGNRRPLSPEAKLAGQFLFGVSKKHYGSIFGIGRSIITPSTLTAAAMRLLNGQVYNSDEAAIHTYQDLFLPPGQTEANGGNTDSARAAEQLFHITLPKNIPDAALTAKNAATALGKIIRRRMTGKDVTKNSDVGQLPDWWIAQPYLAEWPFREHIGLTREMFDQVLEVLLDARDAGRALKSVGKITSFDNSQRVYDDADLQRGFLELQWLFSSGQITRFGIDPSKYGRRQSETRRVLNTSVTEEQRRRLVSNYPDLPLPTYQDLFGNRTASDTSDASRPTVPVWTRFAPTYSDLGLTPRTSIGRSTRDDMFRVARKITDTMEPGFWFHHDRLRNTMLKRAEAALNVRGQRVDEVARSPLRVNINTERLRNLSETDANLTLGRVVEELIREDRDVREIIKTGKKKNEYFDIISSDGKLVGYYYPADRSTGNRESVVKVRVRDPKNWVLANNNAIASKTFDRRDTGHSTALLTRAIRSVPDSTFSMLRAYPAFRVYFVEWDDNVGRESVDRLGMKGRIVRMIDDLYTSNSIVSIAVTDSKDETPVAELQILNTLGTFDRDEFLTDEERKAAGVGGKDDGSEDFLTRMRLQTGTGILIQAGYSSDINGLKTIFTGQIAEISPGKVITVIAQGFKTELDQEVEVTVPNGNPREAIGKLLRINPSKKNLVPHLGRVFDSRDLNSEQLSQIFGGVQLNRTGTFGLQGPNGFLARTFGETINSVERNVWIESDVGPQGFVTQAFRDLTEWATDSPDLEYHFYNKTAWMGLQEMTHHLAGTICAVRPFGAEATVFFGYPDQPYQYRNPSGTEAYEWEVSARPTRVDAILGLEKDVMLKFWGSNFGTTNTLQHAKDVEQAKRIGQTANTGYRRTETGPFRGQKTGNAGRSTINSVGDIQAISGSYTGFVSWSRTVDRYEDLSPEYDDFRLGRKAGMNRIPIFDSLKLDFTQDWDAIQNYNPQMARFVFAYFFNIRYFGGPWPGSMENWWREIISRGMGPLMNGDYSANEGWKNFSNALSGPDPDVSFDNPLFPSKFKDLQNPFSNAPEDLIGYVSEALDKLVKNGTITEAERAERLNRIKDSSKEASLVDDLLNKVDRSTFEGSANPAFRRAVNGDNTVSEVMLSSWPYFRLFVHYFASWLRADLASNDSILRSSDVQRNQNTLDDTQLQPWFKPFRDYHPVFAEHDIIDNSIVASTSAMHNTVLVRGPKEALSKPDTTMTTESGERVYAEDKNWRSWPTSEGIPFHPKLKRSSRKLGIAVEENCNSLERTAQCLMSNMAEGLRPMYRGELKIIGRVVFPWDIMIINDSYNSMYGAIEVERVTHEFNSETGWVTTIVPNAYCHANNPWGLWQLSQMSQPMGWIGFALDAFFWISTIWFGAGLLLNLGKAAATGALRATVNYAAEKGLVLGIAESNAALAAVRETVRIQTSAAIKRGIISKAIAGGANSAGRFLASSFHGVATGMGRTIGGLAMILPAVNPTVDFFFNMTVKNKIRDTLIPVDLRPLSYKGFPLTAGIDLMDEHVIPFGEKAEGVFREITKGIEEFFVGTVPEPIGGSITPPEDR